MLQLKHCFTIGTAHRALATVRVKLRFEVEMPAFILVFPQLVDLFLTVAGDQIASADSASVEVYRHFISMHSLPIEVAPNVVGQTKGELSILFDALLQCPCHQRHYLNERK